MSRFYPLGVFRGRNGFRATASSPHSEGSRGSRRADPDEPFPRIVKDDNGRSHVIMRRTPNIIVTTHDRGPFRFTTTAYDIANNETVSETRATTREIMRAPLSNFSPTTQRWLDDKAMSELQTLGLLVGAGATVSGATIRQYGGRRGMRTDTPGSGQHIRINPDLRNQIDKAKRRLELHKKYNITQEEIDIVDDLLTSVSHADPLKDGLIHIPAQAIFDRNGRLLTMGRGLQHRYPDIDFDLVSQNSILVNFDHGVRIDRIRWTVPVNVEIEVIGWVSPRERALILRRLSILLGIY